MARGGGQTGDPDAYSGLLATKNLPELQDEVYKLSQLLDADLKPQLASLVRRAYLDLVEDLKKIARDVAGLAKEAILREEEGSRVRPPTGNHGDPKLEDSLGHSYPLDAVPGSVGVNFEPELYENVPWWWTNEEGYSGHEGREVHGFFYDAGFTNASAPQASQDRVHPLFEVGGAVDEDGNFYAGAKMVIHNPIPERRFVEHGYDEAAVVWHSRVTAARARFDTQIDRALASATARRPKRP